MIRRKHELAQAGWERRSFLKASVVASGGLLIGFHFPGISALASAQPSSAETFMPNAFVRIGTDERVTVIVNHSEMGQGFIRRCRCCWRTNLMLIGARLASSLRRLILNTTIQHLVCR